MNIPSSISINNLPNAAHMPSVTAEATKVSLKGNDAALQVSRNEAEGVEAMTDDIDLSPESFGELKELFDKAFSLPPPPMPNFSEEA